MENIKETEEILVSVPVLSEINPNPISVKDRSRPNQGERDRGSRGQGRVSYTTGDVPNVTTLNSGGGRLKCRNADMTWDCFKDPMTRTDVHFINIWRIRSLAVSKCQNLARTAETDVFSKFFSAGTVEHLWWIR